MDFSWSNEEQTLFRAIETFARKEFNKNLIENDREAHFNLEGPTILGKARHE